MFLPTMKQARPGETKLKARAEKMNIQFFLNQFVLMSCLSDTMSNFKDILNVFIQYSLIEN